MAKLSEDLQDALKEIAKECESEDDQIRRSQVKQWKKFEEFWHGVQFLFWNEKEQTWISPQSGAPPDLGFSEEEMEQLGPYYDFVINIFTAHGQSIISALASQLPTVKFIPDNGEEEADVDTAKTYDKISDLVARHNNARLMFMKALFYFWINGFVAGYHYTDTSSDYGVYKVPVFEDQDVVTGYVCPDCGAPLAIEPPKFVAAQSGAGDADETSAEPTDEQAAAPSSEAGNEGNEGNGGNEESVPEQTCSVCGQTVEPEPVTKSIPIHTHDEEKPKSRVKIKIYGPLFVKVPYYAMDQEDCGYCELKLDKPKDELISTLARDKNGKIDEELAKKILASKIDSGDRFVKTEYSYPSGPEIESRGLGTVIQYWFRPSTFYKLKSLSKAKELEKKFPKGVKYICIGKDKFFVDAIEESMDERWTFGKGGLSTYIHSDPWCLPLVQIQEMRNQFDNLFMDTFEHQIPSTFADPAVLDFDAYGKFEALPGYMFPAKAAPGKSLSEGFYSENKATIPREAMIYRTALDKDAQFTVGSFPSLYGGPSEGKSRTFSEYNASRQQALQRLQIAWQFASDFYRRNQESCVRMFASMMVEDEHYTVLNNQNYLTVWIKKAQMTGRVGGVESEASDAFPMSLQQKQSFLSKFIEMNNPQINAALYDPANRETLQHIFALDEFQMPGARQVQKQMREVQQMLKRIPTPIDPDIDDDEVHIISLKNTMTSGFGLDTRAESPDVWQLWLDHLKLHQLSLSQKTMAMHEGVPPGQKPDTSAVSDAGGTE